MKSIITALLVSMTCAFAEQTAAPDAPNVNSVEIKATKPKTPATLATGEKFTISIHYNNTGKNPVLIFARPMTNVKKTDGYRAHPSPEYAQGSGDVEGWFSFDSPALVDEVLVTMVDAKTKEVIETAKLPVKITWK
jgi:hypothetical protein